MVPGDVIELGSVRGAYGLEGWVRIAPFAADGNVLEAVRRWWLLGKNPRPLMLQAVKRHGDSILAKWDGCESKEDADALKGGVIAVARSDFPALQDGEYYLSDMVGYRVLNKQGVDLGKVSGIRSGTATQWLEVEQGGAANGDSHSSLLIPLVDQYVEAIEPKDETVRVDWQSDW